MTDTVDRQPTNSAAQANQPTQRISPTGGTSPRLVSLDALRGFDMFWIIGGAELAAGLAEWTDWPLFHWITTQTVHVEWDGFTFWDLIFPLFLFIAGVAMPFSLHKRLERGESKATLYAHICRRGLMLVFLGLVVNGLLLFDFANLRYPSVLGRIGLGYMFGAIIVLNTRVRGQILWAVGILLGYWAAMNWIPVPGFGAGDLTPGHTLADYIDRMLLPGKLYEGVRDPEGILSTVPAIATALLGALAGQWLSLPNRSGHQKAAGLLLAGGLFLGLGELWNLSFPINKNLWSSSFVLYAGGWSLLALGIFYWVIDVCGWQRWAFVFRVIGMNAITIYIATDFINFDGVGDLLFANAQQEVHATLLASSGLLLRWLMLYAMYRQKLFLRV